MALTEVQIDSILREATRLLASGAVDTAAMLLQTAAEQNPEDPRAGALLGRIAAVGGDRRLGLLGPLRPIVEAIPSGGGNPCHPVCDRAGFEQLLREKRFEQALAVMRAAQLRAPENSSIERAIQILKAQVVQDWVARIGSLDLVPAQLAPLRTQLATLDGEALVVLRLVDGKVSYSEVIERSPLGRFDSIRLLVTLLDRGAISTGDRKGAPQEAPRNDPATEAGRGAPRRRPITLTWQPDARPGEQDRPTPPARMGAPKAASPLVATASDMTGAEHFDAGIAAYLARRYEEAELHFAASLRQEPSHAAATHNLAKVRERLGRR